MRTVAVFLLWMLAACGVAIRAEEPGKEAVMFSVKVIGAGRPMILIPGLSCAGNVWDGTVEHFKDRYECHVMTLAGFAGQPGIGEPMLQQIRDGLGRYIGEKRLDRPVIVGHSLGAFMAFWMGATFPDQVGPIIAVDGVPYFPALQNRKATPESVTPLAKSLQSMYRGATPQQAEFSLNAFLKGMVTSDKDFEKVATGSRKSDPKAIAQALYELMTIDLRPQMGAIRAPVLLVGATAMIPGPEQKTVLEENYRLQVGAIPRHQVIFAPKARHFIQLDEPAFLWEKMESFLNAEPPGAAR